MATKPISNFTASWNQNQIYNGIGMNAVDTAANVQSKLINLYHNSVSKFSVDKSGNLNTNEITASSAKIGNFPSGKQRTFADQSMSDILANKIRSFSASISYLEMMTGSNSFINAPKLPGPGITDWNNSIRFSDKTPDDNTGPSVRIRAEATQAGNTIGSVNIYGGELVQIAGGTDTVVGYTNTGPGNTPNAVEINDDNGNTNNSSVTISSPNIRLKPTTNECVKIDGCLEVSGAIWTKGDQLRIGSQSLYLSSSNTESRIYGTNLKISASLVTASRMHIGGPTETSQYNFYDGSKPDLYVNKLRAYSGSFTSIEIISGSEGSMSIRNDKGEVIFSARQSGAKDEVSIFDNIGKFLKEKDPVTGKDNTDFIFGVAGSGKNTVKFEYTDIVMGLSSSISGNLAVKGGWVFKLPASTVGTFDATGSVQIGTKDSNGQIQGLILDKVKVTATDISTNYKNIDGKIEAAVYNVIDGATNYFGTHSIEVKNAAVVKIDGTNAPINLRRQVDGTLFLELGKTLVKSGTQSLYLTGSLLSGSEFKIYAPDNKSSINICHITASNISASSFGTFNKLGFTSITASANVTASSAGSSAGKYMKIKIGNETFKVLLYADS